MNITPYFRWIVDIIAFGIVFFIMWEITGIFVEMFGIHDPKIQFAISLFSAFPLIVVILRTIRLFIDIQLPGSD